jgi:phenylalanyl-tRNA synthetase beta chain
LRVPLSWLRQYVDLPESSQEIADRLAMLGFPVEEIMRRPQITGVVVGKIAKLEKHPNADRLQVGTIDVGSDRTLTVATAATNVAAGQVIPVATIGAKLPHLTIERRKMRGVESEGMMISAEELALPPEWFEEGIMQLDGEIALGTDAVEYFGLADDVLDVEITSNRPDAMSMIGLARELAASYGRPLRLPPLDNPGAQPDPPGAAPRVTIQTPACLRFVAQYVDGVRVAPAPAWMRIRLALAGQRPINNLVDISNYVMLEIGQPLHFYDAGRVADHHLLVRDAHEGERLLTLDDQEHELVASDLVIADERGALGLAGLMGGASSEVRESTNAVVIESASFDGARVRRMSVRLGFRSEASSRHEKELAPALTDAGAARAAQLLVACGAHPYKPHAFGAALSAPAPVTLRAFDVERLLGLRLSPQRIADHLRALGCDVTVAEDSLAVLPPPWRSDLAIPADLIEEVARIEGYDAIEAAIPAVLPQEISSDQYLLENHIASALATLGYDELITYSLHGAKVFEQLAKAGITPSHPSVEVRNPLSEDQRYLRYALGPALLEHIARLDAPARVFEIGHVFWRDDEQHVTESNVVVFGFAAEPIDEAPSHDTHFLRLKGDAQALIRTISGVETTTVRDQRNGLHPGKTAVLMYNGREIASFGRLDPRVNKAFGIRLPVYLCTIYIDAIPEYHIPVYRPPSKYPTTYRDLSLVVDLDVTAERVRTIVADAIGDLCTAVRVFDEYRGPQVGDGKKSLAVRATIGRTDATITDEEASALIERAIAALREEAGAVIRA